uniref:Envelope membrane protein n=1 Tax=Derbesia sp. WEST4838 TaxID=1847751 RepID=A0A1C9JBH3_9CHLO|nr:envelope membrane protein [Derbesia sp. WEST4838]AOP19193.1 envelope membrane protein [Derbesia sp. WEST4838]
MSNSTNQKYSQSFEKLGFIPRSIIRTINRFNQQVTQKSTELLIYEFKISRYQTIASLKCFLTFLIIPLIFHFLLNLSISNFVLQKKLINEEKLSWEFQLNSYYLETENFDEEYFFNTLLIEDFYERGHLRINSRRLDFLKQLRINQLFIIQNKCCNICSDCLTFIFLILLIRFSIPQIIILKSFFLEFLYNLSDTTKSFFLIFITDLLVGFHSSQAWELVLLLIFNRFGFLIQHDILLLIISIFPVILDTIFKYWIFRFLNKISPSTVATYQNMLE